MAIDDATTVDALGLEPETGNVPLIIVDDMDWSDPLAHLSARQTKIGPMQQYRPPEGIVAILDGLGEGLAAMNIGFGHGPLPEGCQAS